MLNKPSIHHLEPPSTDKDEVLPRYSLADFLQRSLRVFTLYGRSELTVKMLGGGEGGGGRERSTPSPSLTQPGLERSRSLGS